GFNLAYMDDDISTEGADDFDTDYMRSLFDHGYARARTGDLWNTELPPEAAFCVGDSFVVEEGGSVFEGSRSAADRLFVKARVPVARSLWNGAGSMRICVASH